jgi:phage shock protein A
MGTLTWIITGSGAFLLGVLIINKLADSRQEIKELEKRVDEWKNITRRWEDAYRQEAKSSRGYKEVAEEAVELGRITLAENKVLTQELAKLLSIINNEK